MGSRIGLGQGFPISILHLIAFFGERTAAPFFGGREGLAGSVSSSAHLTISPEYQKHYLTITKVHIIEVPTLCRTNHDFITV